MINKENKIKIATSSFRDPSGFVFFEDKKVYRQVNQSYKNIYDSIKESGLYEELIKENLLINFQEVDGPVAEKSPVYKILKVNKVPFISYPYEWCFSQLKEAALLTLKIQKKALKQGFSLKDASAYNIQFYQGRPIFIDILSFEKYEEKPWIAYRQFCQHFLAPLSLMSLKDHRLNFLTKEFIDGIPLDLASSILPKKSYFKFLLLSHIHFHARGQKYYADKEIKNQQRKMSKKSLMNLLKSLESAVTSLNWKNQDTEWAAYYKNTNYTKKAFDHKKEIVKEFIKKINPKNIWDLGANNGIFSLLASKNNVYTIAIDNDAAAIESAYNYIKKKNINNILPLVIDLTNPSSSIGWQNKERQTLIERGPSDLIMALALVHHLAISNNTPFIMIAQFFSSMGKNLIVEFVPKKDTKVKKLLSTRKDIFSEYNQDKFEESFKKYFSIIQKDKVKESERILYLMKRI
ncbi:MAG: SAM-dependent methyltransferase [Patescibacteria group bacterium]|nr:SAM-dependent methyltransferase [Patescibacteria group bacterium]